MIHRVRETSPFSYDRLFMERCKPHHTPQSFPNKRLRSHICTCYRSDNLSTFCTLSNTFATVPLPRVFGSRESLRWLRTGQRHTRPHAIPYRAQPFNLNLEWVNRLFQWILCRAEV